MDDNKKLKLFEVITAFMMGFLPKIIERFVRNSRADKYLINIVLLHILVLIFVVFTSYVISVFIR
ncbi:MAG TPA: hypothetical protein DCQ37_02335 [Desulfobacteraceae bacterium]|nr:hypothetical protein [Desulfobacteraceae bacterium]